jgi:hypothetical protein
VILFAALTDYAAAYNTGIPCAVKDATAYCVGSNKLYVGKAYFSTSASFYWDLFETGRALPYWMRDDCRRFGY